MKEIFTRQELLDFNMTWAEVSDAMFIARSTVGAVEQRALAKMRAEFERRGIRYEDLI